MIKGRESRAEPGLGLAEIVAGSACVIAAHPAGAVSRQ